MKDYLNKLGIASYVTAGAILLSLISLIMYIVNSTTGYMAALTFNAVPLVLTILAIVIMVVLMVIPEKLNHIVKSLLLFAVCILLALSVSELIKARADVAGDQWFIPGMETEEKGACLTGAITCAVFYILSLIAVFVSSFMSEHFTKEMK